MYNSINIQPPDTFVNVIDVYGNTAIAIPTYYPFTVAPNPDKKGRWTNDVIPCKNYWDGGWMIYCTIIEIPLKGEIIGWRYIN